MNNIELKITKKPQLEGIRQAIAKKENFMQTQWRSDMNYKDTNCIIVCMILKNFTNYNQIKDTGFWAQDKATVKAQIVKFYSAVIKLDETLKDACVKGANRHLTNYMVYHIIAKKNLLNK
tara:strand:- start:2312 stop:2671 length:360 start_codon:yes stop_codon:yes gene_type:complete